VQLSVILNLFYTLYLVKWKISEKELTENYFTVNFWKITLALSIKDTTFSFAKVCCIYAFGLHDSGTIILLIRALTIR